MPAKGSPQYEEWLRQYKLKRQKKIDAEGQSTSRKQKDKEQVLFDSPEVVKPKVLLSKGKKLKVYSKSQNAFLEVEVIRFVPSANKYLVSREDGKFLYYGADQMVDSAPSKVEIAINGKVTKTLKAKEHKTVVPEGTQSFKIEKAVEPVAYDISRNGLFFDSSELETIKNKVKEETKKLEEMLYSKAGHEFNYNSSAQASKVLFDELGYESDDRSTSAENLEALAAGDPESVPALISRIRSNNKLMASYLDKLKNIADRSVDGRIRNFVSSGAVSGRFTAKLNPALVEVDFPEGIEPEDKIYFKHDLEEIGLTQVCPL